MLLPTVFTIIRPGALITNCWKGCVNISGLAQGKFWFTHLIPNQNLRKIRVNMEARGIDPARPEPMPVNQSGGFEVVPVIVAEINYMLGSLLIDGGRTLIDWL